MGACTLRQCEGGTFEIYLLIVLLYLVLRPIASNVVRYVCPRTQPVDLRTFQQEELFICPPVLVVYWDGILLDDPERMRGR